MKVITISCNLERLWLYIIYTIQQTNLLAISISISVNGIMIGIFDTIRIIYNASLNETTILNISHSISLSHYNGLSHAG